jgi:hypothetical protein
MNAKTEEGSNAVAGQVERLVRHYTPGPWHVASDTTSPANISVRSGRPGQRLAALAKVPKVWWTGGKYEHDSEARDRANARLIAAAPDLLEAAETARHALSALLMSRDPVVYARALRQLDDAIDKALLGDA